MSVHAGRCLCIYSGIPLRSKSVLCLREERQSKMGLLRAKALKRHVSGASVHVHVIVDGSQVANAALLARVSPRPQIGML